MVPGSTLIYGSSLTMLTLSPRASRMAPRDADAMPLPSEETTPPVTKTNRVMMGHRRLKEPSARHSNSRERKQSHMGQWEFDGNSGYHIRPCATISPARQCLLLRATSLSEN